MSAETPTPAAPSNTASLGGFTFTSTDPIQPDSIEIKDREGNKVKNSAPAEEPKPSETSADDGKDPHAVALGKKGGEASAAKRAAEKEADEGDEEAKRLDTELKNTPPEERRSRAQERVAEKAREARALREKLAAEQAERAAERKALEERLAKLESAREPEAKDEDPEPQEADFEVYADYLKAVRAWDRRVALKEFKAQSEQDRQREHYERSREEYATRVTNHVSAIVETFIKQRDEAVKTDPQFFEKVSDDILGLRPSWQVDEGEITSENIIADEIMTSGHAVPMMRYLSEHPEQFQRIASLQTQRDIAREMAKVEHVVSTRAEGATAGNSPSKPKEVSKAPAPPRPVGGAPATAEVGYSPGMDFEEYRAKNQDAVKKRILGL